MLRRPLNPYLVRLRLYGVLLLFVLLSGIQEGQAQLSFAQKASTCTLPNGSITVTYDATGMPPYKFYIDEGSGFINAKFSSTPTVTYDDLVGGNTYYFYGIDQNGDPMGTPFQGSVSLGDLPPPGVNAIAQPATCLNNDGSVQVNAVGGYGVMAYQINNGNFFTQNTFTNLPTGGITVRIRDENGCFSPLTPVTIPLNNDLTASIGPIPPICEGTSIQLPVVSNGLNFSWSPTGGLSDPTIANPQASPTVTTPYGLNVSRGICPTQTVLANVVVNPAPIADAGEDVQTCYEKTVYLHGSGGKTYQWTPTTWLLNPTAPSAIVSRPDTTITYALSVTDANGCTSLKSDSTTVIVTPPLKVLVSPDTVVFVGQPVQLFSLGPADNAGSSYLWTPATGLSSPRIQAPIATLNAPEEIDYTVRITTSVGCSGTATVVVKAMSVSDIFVPNAFSPNNDGHNDVLRPIMPGIKTFQYFTIFDRWGRQVFTTSNAGVGWNGTLNGQVMETGVYVWMAMGLDISGKVVQRKGTVLLVR